MQAKGKRKADAVESDSSVSGVTARGSRSKRMSKPNTVASRRGTLAAKAAGKKISTQTFTSVTIVPRDDEVDDKHERVVLIDNHSQLPVLELYRNKEKAVPMSYLWKDFIRETQLVRDQIGLDVLGSFLTEEEQKLIDLKNNSHIFPELVTSKGCLRSKDNYSAAAEASRTGGIFTRSSATATTSKGDEYRARAKALRAKATAYEKQSEAYEQAATLVDLKFDAKVDENQLTSAGMTFLANEIPLTRKELNGHLQAHEAHLIAVAEKLRGEMSSVAIFVQRAEKRLRDEIQLKVAADLKLLRDIKRFGKFELQAWQIEALPQETHQCKCPICQQVPEGDAPDGAKYLFGPDFPQGDMDDVLPDIKLEDSPGAVNDPGAVSEEGATNEVGTANDPGASNEEGMDTDGAPEAI